MCRMYVAASPSDTCVTSFPDARSMVLGSRCSTLQPKPAETTQQYAVCHTYSDAHAPVCDAQVDGFGAALLDFDDPNLPSLLAMPLLGYEWYDRQAYANTRQRVLSGANPYMYRGSHFHGLGSPHTPNR